MTEARRYMGPDLLAKSRLTVVTGPSHDEGMTTQAITA